MPTPKLIVADSKGKTLRDLDASGIVVGEVVGVADSAPPVTFMFGMTAYRREQNAPFFIGGDNGSVPNPWTATGNVLHVLAFAGPDQTPLDMVVPVKPAPPPVTPPQPVAPPMEYIDAVPMGPNRGDGLTISTFPIKDGKITVENKFVRYHSQNVVSGIIDKKIPIFLNNVRSAEAWRMNEGTPEFQGQNFYLEKCGRVTMRGCASLNNLFPDRAANRVSMFLHACYQNSTCDYLDIQWCALGNTPNAGVEFKGSGIIQDALLFNCGTGLLTLRGPVTYKRCVIFDGHRYASGKDANHNPTGWTGDTAPQSYGYNEGENICIVGGPIQSQPDPTTGVPSTDMGCLNGSAQYGNPPTVLEDGTTCPGATWKLKNIHVSNWRGPLVSGDAPPSTGDIDTSWRPAAVPTNADIVRRLSDPTIPVKDTVMWVFKMMQVPWLSSYGV